MRCSKYFFNFRFIIFETYKLQKIKDNLPCSQIPMNDSQAFQMFHSRCNLSCNVNEATATKIRRETIFRKCFEYES